MSISARVSGVNSLYGGLGGHRARSVRPATAATAQAGIPAVAGSGQGLTKNNEVQTTSFGVSPYLVQRFGDWGTGRLGASVDVARIRRAVRFRGGAVPHRRGQRPDTAHQRTDRSFRHRRYSAVCPGLVRHRSRADTDHHRRRRHQPANRNAPPRPRGIRRPRGRSSPIRSPTRSTATSRYSPPAATRTSTIPAPMARSSGIPIGAPSIHDLTWSFGTTLTPDPDSALTLSYGHQNGINSFSANGHYQP